MKDCTTDKKGKTGKKLYKNQGTKVKLLLNE